MTIARKPVPARAAPAVSPATTAGELLAWYDTHRRDLPWRARPGETPDPYAVWLSEVMLQQTTVRAVVPYYHRFLQRWPDVTALAAAPTEAVMQAWAGLGYYSRARNLHACAIRIARDGGGRFPDTEAGLRALPGIGAYTAAAIAAIAFGRHATVVDGNVERVMARLHAVETPLPQARPELARHMATATPHDRAGDFAQATMDLGATICTPRGPACILCPLRLRCCAAALGRQDDLPRRQPRRATVYRHGLAFLVTDQNGRVLVRTRPPRGLLGGMAELPGTAWIESDAEPPPQAGSAAWRPAGRVTHAFTHFTLHLDVVVATRADDLPSVALEDTRWVDRAAIEEEPWPTLMRNALAVGLAARDASRQFRRVASRRHHMN